MEYNNKATSLCGDGKGSSIVQTTVTFQSGFKVQSVNTLSLSKLLDLSYHRDLRSMFSLVLNVSIKLWKTQLECVFLFS